MTHYCLIIISISQDLLVSYSGSCQKNFSYILTFQNWIGKLNAHATKLHCHKRHTIMNDLTKGNENGIECLGSGVCG